MRRLTSGGRGYPDLREPYLHIFGNLGVARHPAHRPGRPAQLSLATASELVSGLQALRYLRAQLDPGPGRRPAAGGE